MAAAAVFIGFSGAAFNRDTTVEVKVGDKFPLGRYEIKVSDIKMGQNENYIWQNAIVEATVDGKPFATLTPERRIYEKSQQPVSMVAIKRQLNEDLYINFAGMGSESQRPTSQAYVFPLVSWIWAGYWVLLFGSLICLVPAKIKMQYARTEVVGVSTKHVPATK